MTRQEQDKGTVLLSREDNGIAVASILSNGETTVSVMFPITHYIWGLDRVLAKIDKTTNKSYYYLYNGKLFVISSNISSLEGKMEACLMTYIML